MYNIIIITLIVEKLKEFNDPSITSPYLPTYLPTYGTQLASSSRQQLGISMPHPGYCRYHNNNIITIIKLLFIYLMLRRRQTFRVIAHEFTIRPPSVPKISFLLFSLFSLIQQSAITVIVDIKQEAALQFQSFLQYSIYFSS